MWNCLGKPTALVEVEEIACNGTDERLTVTGKLICSATMPRIDKVIFNDPATIVFWSDGTKTVVKAHDETFDREKGLAMAISKKVFGNKGRYFNLFKKYCTGEEESEEFHQCTLNRIEDNSLIKRQDAIDALNEYFARIGKLKRRGLTKGEKAISLDTVGTIKTLPPAEPERNTGEWITDTYGKTICSECGWCAPQIMTGCLANRHLDYEKSEFCWHCGADMRGE